MSLRVSGKNLDIGESLRIYVGARIDGVVAKYSAEPTSGHVTVEREGSGFRTDCTLHFNSGIILQAEAEALDAYASFNKAADRIEKRLRRLKGRVRVRPNGAHRSGAVGQASDASLPRQSAINGAATEMHAPQSPEEKTPLVIAEPVTNLKEMSVSQAVEELDVGNVQVVIFRHCGDGRANIVYRRSDGNIGWIDTAGTNPSSNQSPNLSH